MTGRKAVLNVTVADSIAAAVRGEAAARNTTISSVVEQALAAHLEHFRRRREGLAAIDEYYREHGYPTSEQSAAAEAQVAEEEQLLDDSRVAMAVQRAGPRAGQAAPRAAQAESGSAG
jgi:hypothetical protein